LSTHQESIHQVCIPSFKFDIHLDTADGHV
jgi:hypothetical protein